MYRGRGVSMAKAGGFTVVETLIFLAISAAIFVSAMVLINGRQGKAQFDNAVRNFEASLIDIANDVANGYYKSSDKIQCNAPGGVPNVTSVVIGSKDLGTNDACIFIGRAIMPSDAGAEALNIYSLVGAREVPSGTPLYANQATRDVKTLGQANPRLVYPTGLLPADESLVVATQDIGNGATVGCIKIDTGAGLGGSCSNRYAIAFLTDIQGGIAAANADRSGTGVRAILYAYQVANYDTSILRSRVATTTAATYDATKVKAATICLKSGTTNQYGLVKIGSTGASGASSLTITSEISNTPCM